MSYYFQAKSLYKYKQCVYHTMIEDNLIL